VTPPSDGQAGPNWRLLIGVLLFMVAIVLAIYGFRNLVRILESGGYGTPAMRNAFGLLGAAGALLASGVATIIWDIAKRYEDPGSRKR
jgi:hypothetical protein